MFPLTRMALQDSISVYNVATLDEVSQTNLHVTCLPSKWSEEDLGRSSGATKYENEGYGITFNVNDDLSIGYNHAESDKSSSAAHGDAEADSLQAAYTMGGASIRLAEATADNMVYSTATSKDRDATTLSVSLAF